MPENNLPQARQTTCATGYLAHNWSGFNTETAALVVNPQASLLELLGWCWGEIRSLQASAQAFDAASAAGGIIEPRDFGAIFSHRLDPLVEVMTLALNELHAERQAPLAAD